MQNDTTVVSKNPAWLRRHGQKVAALLLWALLIGGYQGPVNSGTSKIKKRAAKCAGHPLSIDLI